jgi:hypothetical protein
MPTLLFFAPCEKAIIDETTKSFSLISLLEEITVEVAPNSSPPPNVVLPFQWAITTLWQQQTPNENGHTFQQRVTFSPDSEPSDVMIETVADFTFSNLRQRVIARVVGLRIGKPGAHTLKLWIRDKKDSEDEWREVASFPMQLIFNQSS